ncbi:MAG TPA: DinB family protein [Acidimicrobiales bacterium]|jgi:hypothetical protein|nr:DinB family protein [Acidimicrobiales bacterium]
MASLDPATAVARLKGTRRELVALLGTAKPDQLRRAPGPDDWAPATVLAHLADAELVYGVRIRMILTGDRPYIAAYDEEAWVERFAELEDDVKETLARWRALRDANLRVFASLEEGEWELTGVHAERGEQTIAQIAALMAKHDADHVDQIRTGLATDD